MSEPMRFPKDPLQGTEGRFRDEHGNNPFSDQDRSPPIDAAPAENVFATSVDGEATDQQPEYEEFSVANRSTLPLSIGGLVVSVIAAVLLIWEPLTIFICIAGLALSISAVVMGRNDLRAMHAGAMDKSDAGRTMLAVILGLIGAAAAAIPSTISIVVRRSLF